MKFSRYEGQLHDANADDLAVSEQVEHGPDGTRWHEDSSYEGTVYPCLCGERFVEHSALLEHIEKHATEAA